MRVGLAAVSLAILLAGRPAIAAERHDLRIAAGSLQSAVIALGRQADVTIGMTDPRLGAIAVPALQGRHTVAAALRILLADSNATFVEIDDQTFQLTGLPRPTVARPRKTAMPIDDADGRSIVVTGSKRAAALDDYPGGVRIIDVATLRPGSLGQGTQALIAQLPIVSSTHLGPGRDKIFIRGIADSSFTGPTQATVGQYLGDVRLNYNAPDPNLALYDIQSVEVLEGPQATLYGAGSLGGIIRLTPVAPDPTRIGGSLSLGATAMAHGEPGGDGAAIANLPLVTDRLGLRLVVYAIRDGGYIDDPSRGLRDINRTSTRGVRATMRFVPRGDWTIDLGGVLQNINSRDGQYAERGFPPLERASALAQPFDNDYSLASVTVHHDAGATRLVSATSLVDHEVGSLFDATTAGIPQVYTSQDEIRLIANETRLSHRAPSGAGWVVGIAALYGSDRLARAFGPPDAPASIGTTRTTVAEGALFGEAGIALSARWLATAGIRLNVSRLNDRITDVADEGDGPRRDTMSALPSVAVRWKAGDNYLIYARYQEGYRPGGLSVTSTATQRFDADGLSAWEVGARLGGPDDLLKGSTALTYAHWEKIQADLVDGNGFPFTANIGSGRIFGLEAAVTLRPRPGLTFDAAVSANLSRLTRPAAAFAGEDDASLPNIPDVVARVGAIWHVEIARHRVDLSGSARYVGHSRLGVGTSLDISQGGYVDTTAGFGIALGRMTMSLDLTNLLDERRNIFALGDPFAVARRQQITPLRPRALRLGATVGF